MPAFFINKNCNRVKKTCNCTPSQLSQHERVQHVSTYLSICTIFYDFSNKNKHTKKNIFFSSLTMLASRLSHVFYAYTRSFPFVTHSLLPSLRYSRSLSQYSLSTHNPRSTQPRTWLKLIKRYIYEIIIKKTLKICCLCLMQAEQQSWTENNMFCLKIKWEREREKTIPTWE